jgi:peptide/nickel transport system permease protein
MIAIAAAQVPIFARLLRGSLLSQRGADYVLAASSLGLRQRTVVPQPHAARTASGR